MAYIKVDHSKFAVAASSVDTYLSKMKSKMRSAESEVNAMSSAWQGDDYSQFRRQWDTVDGGDSVYGEMVKALRAYSEFLKHAANKYKDAQTKAVNRANDLPRW